MALFRATKHRFESDDGTLSATVQKDFNTSEYRVRFYHLTKTFKDRYGVDTIRRTLVPEDDYFTEDLEDAINTAKYECSIYECSIADKGVEEEELDVTLEIMRECEKLQNLIKELILQATHDDDLQEVAALLKVAKAHKNTIYKVWGMVPETNRGTSTSEAQEPEEGGYRES